MAKKIKTTLKLNLPAGEATPAPPVGPALGQHGLPIMEFVKAFNEKTASQKGTLVPAVITVYEDRTYDFIIKKPPVSDMIKKALNLEKGATKAGRENSAKLTDEQLTQIAKQKMSDLNTDNIKQAKKIVAGTARSMGVNVVESTQITQTKTDKTHN